MKKLIICFAVVFTLSFSYLWTRQKNQSRDVAAVNSLNLEQFMYDDLGGVNPHTSRNNALPWGIAKYIFQNGAQQLGIINEEQTWVDALKAAGFLFPETSGGIAISNQLNREIKAKKYDNPVGIAITEVKVKAPFVRFKYNAMNLNCAACHSSPSYNAEGLPDPTNIWLGAPSPSINYVMYSDMLYAGIQHGIQHEWRRIFNKKFKQNSKLSITEMVIITTLITKNFNKNRIDCRKNTETYCLEFKRRYPNYSSGSRVPGVLLPFSPGAPGITNGVSILGFYTETLKDIGSNYGFTSIVPLANRNFKSSYLYDGFYMGRDKGEKSRYSEVTINDLPIGDLYDTQLASVISMFTVPVMGNTIEQATNRKAVEQTKKVTPVVTNYKSRPFPGAVNIDSAKNGHKLYETNCASCHGSYKWDKSEPNPYLHSFPNKLIATEEIKTDPERANLYKKDILQDLIKDSFVGKNIIIKSAKDQNKGYVAMPLGELWLSAPYFHNGSVPTLWHLLRPELRPSKFLTGGHKLDFEKVGVSHKAGSTTEYEASYKPYSRPVIVDTNKKGFSNKGHEAEFELITTEKEKDELLEFLKLL